MEMRRLGRTGLEVSRLGIGGLFVSSYGAAFDDGRAAVLRAVAGGCNYIDTAPGYANSEEVLGKVLREVPQPVVLSTKIGGRPTPFDPRNAAQLRQSIETSLSLLGRDRIDILMVHEPDRPGQYDWWTDPEAVEGPVLDVLSQCRDEGLIGFLGLGGTTTHELALLCDSGKFDVVLTAFNFSLLYREAMDEVVPAAQRHDMGIVAGSPLQQGLLAKRYDAEIAHGWRWMSKRRREQFRALYAFLDEVEVPLAELSLRFVLSNPAFHSVLMGARNLAETEANLAACSKGPLPADWLARLDEIHAMVPFRPCEEPFCTPLHHPLPQHPGPAGR